MHLSHKILPCRKYKKYFQVVDQTNTTKIESICEKQKQFAFWKSSMIYEKLSILLPSQMELLFPNL